MAAPFYVRLAVLRDIPRITEISLAGRPDDPAFDYLWRYRCQYPDDNYFFSMQKFKATLYDPKRTVLVAVERPPKSADNEAHEEALETIVGYAVWERNGSRSGALPWFLSVWQAGPWDLLHRNLTTIENWAISHQFQRRDSDPARVAAFFGVMDKVHAKYWERLYPRNYHLEILATHPDYRRRGAATSLIKWGVFQALREGVDAGLESSPMAFSLYRKLGFALQEEVVIHVDGDDSRIMTRVMLYDKKK